MTKSMIHILCTIHALVYKTRIVFIIYSQLRLLILEISLEMSSKTRRLDVINPCNIDFKKIRLETIFSASKTTPVIALKEVSKRELLREYVKYREKN